MQSPYLLVLVIAQWTGTLSFLFMRPRTANHYALMLAGYTLSLIALPEVGNPWAVWDVAEARTEEIFLGILRAALTSPTASSWPDAHPLSPICKPLAPTPIGVRN